MAGVCCSPNFLLNHLILRSQETSWLQKEIPKTKGKSNVSIKSYVRVCGIHLLENYKGKFVRLYSSVSNIFFKTKNIPIKKLWALSNNGFISATKKKEE